ncbi:MAG: SRPBCC family protein, partial [Ktedonobacteraceae bacterium]|nr:SRPBCC family protein [Ktedonobacteraceae bacterium]
HPELDGTRLKENVQIDAPALLMRTVYKGAIQSHQEMFANLKILFE